MPGPKPRSEAERLLDEDLVDSYYSCEEAAFDELSVRHSQRLWAFFRSLGFDEYQCADFKQECLLKLVLGKRGEGPRFERTKGRGMFRAWLRTAASNLARDVWRRQNRWELDDLDEEESETSLPERPPDDWIGPTEVFETLVLAQTLKRCLGDLSAGSRQIFVLKYYEGYSVKEIEEMLGLSYTQVNNTLFRTREKVRKRLEEKGFEYRPAIAPGPIGEVVLRFEDEVLVYIGERHKEEDDE
jgi:RNA polymerase sigma-70 factor (ECF subfamily)